MKEWQLLRTIATTLQPVTSMPAISPSQKITGSVIANTTSGGWQKRFRSLSLRARFILVGVALALACVLWYAWARNPLLTRKKALAMLQELKFDPETEIAHTLFSDTFPPLESESQKDWKRANVVKFYVAAMADGLIEMKPSMEGRYKVWEAHSTGKGKEFIHFEDGKAGRILAIDMGTKKAAQVTSVGAPSQLGGKTVSVVNFDYAYTPTPFGAAFDRGTGYKTYSGQKADTAVFALYDDGWHLEGTGR